MNRIHPPRQDCPCCGAVIEFAEARDFPGAQNNATETAVESTPARGQCDACGAELDVAAALTINASPPQAGVLAAQRPPVRAEDMFLPAMSLFRRRWGVLLSVSLATWLLWVALVVVPGRWLGELWQQSGGDAANVPAALLGTAIYAVVGLIVTAYSMAVMMRATVRIVRWGDGPIRLRVPVAVVLRIAWTLSLASLGLAAMMGAGVALMVVAALVWEPERAVLIGSFLAGLLIMAAAFVMQWWVWPSLFLIADERADWWHSLIWGNHLICRNVRVSLILVIAYVAVSTVGALPMTVGQIVTTPLAMMPLAMAYVRMTGGRDALTIANFSRQC